MGTVHVIPMDDLIEHELSDDCPCGPQQMIEIRPDGSMGWVTSHPSLDGRELHEW
jgi:hypothetical protein